MRSLIIISALIFSITSSDSPNVIEIENGIQLRGYCPPGFEKTTDNRCISRNLYQQYGSLRNSGVGGLKSSLPVLREGFSPQQIDLGRYLFFDPRLSKQGNISCSSCHDPDLGFSDGRSKSIGTKNTLVRRSAPSLWNAGYLNSFFWDGRAKSLEEQLKGPLYSEDEMGNTPSNLYKTLNSIDEYVSLFREAFPTSSGEVSLEEVYTALAAFEASLISVNSRYDQYAHGYHEALNENEIQGLNIFRSFVARCAECHTPPLFTNQQIAVIGTPESNGDPFDVGAEEVQDDPTLKGGFKVPSLRNIEKTAPYFHSGRFESLRDAVEFYNLGRGHAVPDSIKLKLHWHVHEPNLRQEEIDRLVDFLKTLTDESFKPSVPVRLPAGMAVLDE